MLLTVAEHADSGLSGPLQSFARLNECMYQIVWRTKVQKIRKVRRKIGKGREIKKGKEPAADTNA